MNPKASFRNKILQQAMGYTAPFSFVTAECKGRLKPNTMKKIIIISIFLLMSASLFCQNLQIIDKTTPRPTYNNDQDTTLYQKDLTLQQFIFNISASFQMYAKYHKINEGIKKPVVVLNGIPVDPDNLKNIKMDELENFEFWTGVKAQAIYGSSTSYGGLVIIKTKSADKPKK